MFVAGADGNGASIERTRFESNEVGLFHFGGNSAAVSNRWRAEMEPRF